MQGPTKTSLSRLRSSCGRHIGRSHGGRCRNRYHRHAAGWRARYSDRARRRRCRHRRGRCTRGQRMRPVVRGPLQHDANGAVVGPPDIREVVAVMHAGRERCWHLRRRRPFLFEPKRGAGEELH